MLLVAKQHEHAGRKSIAPRMSALLRNADMASGDGAAFALSTENESARGSRASFEMTDYCLPSSRFDHHGRLMPPSMSSVLTAMSSQTSLIAMEVRPPISSGCGLCPKRCQRFLRGHLER